MQTTLMTCILQTVFDIRLIFCSNLYRYMIIKTQNNLKLFLIRNFFKFIIIFNKCKVYTWTYMQYSMLPYDMVVYDTLWTLCTEYQYWNFPFEFDFCAAILTFVLVFFVICSLPFWWKKTVEYMYLFNSLKRKIELFVN